MSRLLRQVLSKLQGLIFQQELQFPITVHIAKVMLSIIQTQLQRGTLAGYVLEMAPLGNGKPSGRLRHNKLN